VADQFKRIVRIPSHRQISRVDLRSKRVLLRVDFNVPVENGQIEDVKRIWAALPTIKKCLERGAAEVNIVSHFGRPKNSRDEAFSTKIIAKKLSEIMREKRAPRQGVSDIDSPALARFYQITPKVRLFENLRFDPGEEKNSAHFAKQLSALGDICVIDAFANLHRNHASMVAIQDFLPTYAGLLVEREVNVLFRLLNQPERPFVCIVGGAKVEDKLPIIEAFSESADAVLIGGMTANEYILQEHPKGENIFLPNDGINKVGGIVPINQQTLKSGIFDIGPQTIMLYKSVLSSAKTIFWNGNMGMSENKRYVHGTFEIARFISKLKADKIASGGNTVEVIDELNLADRFSFLSTGGGATSDFVAGKKLPALERLLK
jgi:phosphoglycerate kinase